MMIRVTVKGTTSLQSKLTKISKGLAPAAATGLQAALKATSNVAISLAPHVVGKCIKWEILELDTRKVIGRVYTDTTITNFAPYVEFGTGVKVDDQGNNEAIRLKRAKKIPWYIHVSMVPKSFERYGYPLVTGVNGEQYWEVDGMKPHPYMHPAAFNRRDENVEAVASAIQNLLQAVEK